MKLSEIITAKLSTDPDDYSAYVTDTGDKLPSTFIPVKDISTFEPDEKFQDKDNVKNLKDILIALKQGKKLPPILVRKHGNGYQVIDGHHRLKAYKLLNKKYIPAHIISTSNIKNIN